MQPLEVLLLKLADGEKLSPDEREGLRLIAQDLDRNRIETGSWIGEGSQAVLKSPAIFNPDFRTSPLSVFHCDLETDTEILNNTDTPITFENYWGDNSVFDFYQNDKSKIKVNQTNFTVAVFGMVNWETNATGERSLTQNIYNASDVLIGQQPLHRIPAVSGLPTVVPFVCLNPMRGSTLDDAAYLKMIVEQNSGGGLDVRNFFMSVCIA